MKYYITSEATQQRFKYRGFKGEAVAIDFDASQWAEINGALTTATWTNVAGSAAVSGAALASSVASALVTLGSAGGSLIKVSLTNGTETILAYLETLAEDPSQVSSDYW